MSTPHAHEQVAAAATLDVRHAAAAEPEHPARLRARRDDEVLGAVERVERQMRAERGLGERDVQLVDEVVAIAREPVVRHGPARGRRGRRRARRGPDRAAPGEPQGRAGVDAGGDVDGVGVLLDRAPFAPASSGTAWR